MTTGHAVIALVNCAGAAWIVFRLLGASVDHAESWDRSTLNDIYSHPDSRVGPAAWERPGPGQTHTEDLT